MTNLIRTLLNMADYSAKAANMARILAIVHIIVGFLLFCFGIADLVVEYFYTGYLCFGIWMGIWVSLSVVCKMFLKYFILIRKLSNVTREGDQIIVERCESDRISIYTLAKLFSLMYRQDPCYI